MRPGRAFSIVAGSAVAVQAAPSLSAITPLRRSFLSGLSGAGDPGRVALTFDDGPDPASTPAFLDLLAELDVRATFFVLGRMLTESPDLGRRLAREGHEVAVHGWDHRPLVLRTPRSTCTDLRRAVIEVTSVCGVRPTRWRPPYGVLSTASLLAARHLHLTPVLWTTWGRDWERRATAASVRAEVARHLSPGGTVLLHDSDCTAAPGSWRATLGALPDVVADVRAAGLVPGRLLDHARPAGRS
jgi:peptidoglycan/xylan/chitin deacetylase (PgdA/CDA1 family)